VPRRMAAAPRRCCRASRACAVRWLRDPRSCRTRGCLAHCCSGLCSLRACRLTGAISALWSSRRGAVGARAARVATLPRSRPRGSSSATLLPAGTGSRYEPASVSAERVGGTRAGVRVLVRADSGVRVVLSGVQVEQLVRELSGRGSVTGVLGEVPDLDAARRVLLPLINDNRYSRSQCRSLLVLAACPAGGSWVELTDVARELEISPSTVHRYLLTWMAIGLIEQDAQSRRYRRPPSESAGSEREPSPSSTSDAG
jgi:hypothetical protein